MYNTNLLKTISNNWESQSRYSTFFCMKKKKGKQYASTLVECDFKITVYTDGI